MSNPCFIIFLFKITAHFPLPEKKRAIHSLIIAENDHKYWALRNPVNMLIYGVSSNSCGEIGF